MKQVRLVVKKAFKDLVGNDHIYYEGDNYPVKGPVDIERVLSLISDQNKQGEPLLEIVEEEVDYSALFPQKERSKKTEKKKVVEGDEV